MDEDDLTFSDSIEAISNHFMKYSVEDIASSLFVSHLWLPNVSSIIKHQLLVSILASTDPAKLSQTNRIDSYADFSFFMEEILKVIPYFFMLEDYIPETDWGNVEFYHNDDMFKIFYGQEMENVYDFLSSFQMIYSSHDESYLKLSGRSPSIEMSYCLRMQQDIIDGIKNAPVEELDGIEPGDIEIPPESFWESANTFYQQYPLRVHFEEKFLSDYSIVIGSWPCEKLEENTFSEMAFDGRNVPFYFLKHKDCYYPILPRRYTSILYDTWAELYRQYHEDIDKEEFNYTFIIGKELFKYTKARISSSFLEPLVCALFPDEKPHKTVFPMALISKDELILFYIMPPYLSKEQLEDELLKVIPDINDAIVHIKREPVSLGLILKQGTMRFASNTNKILKPRLLVILPLANTAAEAFALPRTFDGKFVTLEQVLGIIDEIDGTDDFASLFEFIDKNSSLIMGASSGLLDLYGVYIDSNAVLIEGATKPDMVTILPHWGTNHRFRSLSEFWMHYPKENYRGHPRSWKIKQETQSRILFESRTRPDFALHCKVKKTHVFITAPFDDILNYEDQFHIPGRIAKLLVECLEDAMSTNYDIISNHDVFDCYTHLEILFYPDSLIAHNENYGHLEKLRPGKDFWKSDVGFFEKDVPGIRVVFNDTALTEAFSITQDRSLETGLLIEAMKRLNEIVPSENMPEIIEKIDQRKTGRPRFTLLKTELTASFPQFAQAIEPQEKHFKMAKCRLAELAQESSFSEGYYESAEAQNKLNTLRDKLILEIHKEVTKYKYSTSVPFLISNTDALTNKYEHDKMVVEHSMKHDVDYNREEKYRESHSDFIKMHNNCRYLIEKFVQVKPTGKEVLNKEGCQYLMALVDWLLSIYAASDILHYRINTVGMDVTSDFLFDIVYDESWKQKQKAFGGYMSKISLGAIGKSDDRVSSPRPVEDYLKELDNAFIEDVGFSYRTLIGVLTVLSKWPEYKRDCGMKTCYSASRKTIEETCSKNVKMSKKEDLGKVVDFLTLKRDGLLRLVGEDKECLDLPIWEHRKRSMRYTIRPLIMIKNKYYWGAYAVFKSREIWFHSPDDGALPVDLGGRNIEEILQKEKELISGALENKTFEIVARYTKNVEKNCWLHKRNSMHPDNLGDFDVLAYLPQNNVVLNIECKDNLPPYCYKDVQRLCRTIFGLEDTKKNHFEKIFRRQNYLADNIFEVFKTLNWTIDEKLSPTILTIYLTRRSYLWTLFPPIEIDTIFLRVDVLAEFIEALN